MRDEIEGIEQRRVIKEFAERRKKIYLLILLCASLIGVVLFATLQLGVLTRPASAALMVVVFVFALFIHLRLWRCPHCNKNLGKLYIGLNHPKFCPECGVRLTEE